MPRKKGSVCDFIEERNRNLKREYYARVARFGGDYKALTKELARIPADRFYISEDRAYCLVKKMLETGRSAGDLYPDALPMKRLMIEEIFRRVRRLNPQMNAPALKDAVYGVVNQQAPSFYLTPRSILVTLYKYLKGS